MTEVKDEGNTCGELMESLKFFMPMEHVPTSTAQEKGYKVVTQKTRTGTVKHRVLVFEKPQAEQAKRILMESLNQVRVGMHRKDAKPLTRKKLVGEKLVGGRITEEKLAGENQKSRAVRNKTECDMCGNQDDGSYKIDVLVCPEYPLYPKGVPLSLSVKWCFENYRIGSDGRKTVTHPHGSYRVTKPDTDNLNKALKDCMTELGFWADDAQVVEEQIGKYWSQVPGVFVEIRVLKQ